MKKFKFLPILLTLLICAVSCSSDDDENTDGFDGSIASIENFYTPELLNALDDLSFVINEGNTPPIIDGTYLANPVILSASNIAADNIGSSFTDLQIMFSNQNNDALTLAFEGLESNFVIESVESYISGSEDSFSVFLKVESTSDEHTSIVAYAFSGTLSTEGILNYQCALLMLDDNGDPNSALIENNQGRLFIDGNALCSKISEDSRASTNLKIINVEKNTLPALTHGF